VRAPAVTMQLPSGAYVHASTCASVTVVSRSIAGVIDLHGGIASATHLETLQVLNNSTEASAEQRTSAR